MSRKDELLKCFEKVDPEKKDVAIKLIEYTVELEERLDKIRKLPMIEVHPTNNLKQRATPASKLYKDMLGAYNVCVKNLLSVLGKTETAEESPLRLYLKRLEQNAD